MDDRLLLGLWRFMLPIPRLLWQRQVGSEVGGLDFMSEDHRRVHHFAVRELPRLARPMEPGFIARELDLPLERVAVILTELEQKMTFLFRDDSGAVTWAYPVTVDRTPHRVTFSSGEQIYAAWGIDAIAMPFVQGRLRNENLSFVIQTECGHCHQPLQIEMDSKLKFHLSTSGAEPVIYSPLVDFGSLEDPSIIDAFWMKSIFFWSEEHAREYRRSAAGERGVYMTLPQSIYVTRKTQSVLFGFELEEE